jgi:hypothetical protein
MRGRPAECQDLHTPDAPAAHSCWCWCLQVEDVCELLLTHPFFINYRLDRIASRGCYLKVGCCLSITVRAGSAVASRCVASACFCPTCACM